MTYCSALQLRLKVDLSVTQLGSLLSFAAKAKKVAWVIDRLTGEEANLTHAGINNSEQELLLCYLAFNEVFFLLYLHFLRFVKSWMGSQFDNAAVHLRLFVNDISSSSLKWIVLSYFQIAWCKSCLFKSKYISYGNSQLQKIHSTYNFEWSVLKPSNFKRLW